MEQHNGRWTSNAKKGPAKDFNSYKDFSDVELDAQVIACSMVHFKMENINGKYDLIDIKVLYAFLLVIIVSTTSIVL